MCRHCFALGPAHEATATGRHGIVVDFEGMQAAVARHVGVTQHSATGKLAAPPISNCLSHREKRHLRQTQADSVLGHQTRSSGARSPVITRTAQCGLHPLCIRGLRHDRKKFMHGSPSLRSTATATELGKGLRLQRPHALLVSIGRASGFLQK